MPIAYLAEDGWHCSFCDHIDTFDLMIRHLERKEGVKLMTPDRERGVILPGILEMAAVAE